MAAEIAEFSTSWCSKNKPTEKTFSWRGNTENTSGSGRQPSNFGFSKNFWSFKIFLFSQILKFAKREFDLKQFVFEIDLLISNSSRFRAIRQTVFISKPNVQPLIAFYHDFHSTKIQKFFVQKKKLIDRNCATYFKLQVLV